ncbi:MAG: HAMP domain-containing sensor histidine kinase [Peptostreptococcaceae bacterium]|nr:HAMP domain-containing sensor histidine kinase [Peptostreptococcaceae bacterium]
MAYMIIAWLASLFLIYYMTKRRIRRRIEEIVHLIGRMKRRDYSIPMKQDAFSILEDQMYKIFMELVEEKEKASIRAKNQIEYLEDIAHQIKTPITSMLFSIELIQDSKEAEEELRLLKKQLQRLNSLADVLLKLSSLDSGTEEMKKDEFELRELIEYALEIVEIPGRIRIFLEESIRGKQIRGDFYWLSEALINILKNAADMPRCTKLEIGCEENPLYTSLYIRDDAGGIEKTKLRKIFRRFYKNPDSKGFGIGLSMAKSIVEKNNGVIEVSNIHKGAEFKIKLYHVT